MKTELRRARWPSLILQPHTWTLGIVFFIDVFVSMNIGRGRKLTPPHFMEVPHRIHKRPPPELHQSNPCFFTPLLQDAF